MALQQARAAGFNHYARALEALLARHTAHSTQHKRPANGHRTRFVSTQNHNRAHGRTEKMQAIITKVLPPTNTRGCRIKAQCARGSFVVSYPDAENQEAAHVFAVNALVARFANEDARTYKTPRSENTWLRPRVVGQLPSGDYAHVYTGEKPLAVYELSFIGRPVGAIGAFHRITATREARSLRDATRQLYEALPVAFEHITGVELVSTKEGAK
jgi:hypothetical protein